MSDPYLKKVQEHWGDITKMYEMFEHKAPIIEIDVGHCKSSPILPRSIWTDSAIGRERKPGGCTGRLLLMMP